MNKDFVLKKFIVLAVFIITVYVFPSCNSNSNSKSRGNKTSSSVVKKVNEKTYFEIRKETLAFSKSDIDTININALFIEYKYRSVRKALIIRRDSIVGIISSTTPELINSFHKDSVEYLSFSLLNLIDRQLPDLSFAKRNDMMFSKNRKAGVNFLIGSDCNEVLQLKIDSTNYYKHVYKNIIKLFVDLVPKVDYSELNLVELGIAK